MLNIETINKVIPPTTEPKKLTLKFTNNTYSKVNLGIVEKSINIGQFIPSIIDNDIK